MRMRAIGITLVTALTAAGMAMSAQQQGQQPGMPNQARCQQMMSQRGDMVQRMDAMDKKMDDLIAEMNKARGDRKVDAMAKVITEMAAQRKEMHESMMQMTDMAMSGGMCGMMMQGMMPQGTTPAQQDTPKQ